MTDPQVIHGVYLSETLDLEEVYGFALNEKDVQLHRPEDVTAPAQIAFAICWLPGEEAFDPYPNLKLAMSIGAGLDALLAHPGLRPELRPDIEIARVRDPHQAALMAGYAVHEVLHYERGFGEMMGNAATRRWTPLPMRAPERAVVAVLGNGTMGQAIVDGLKALGFSVQVACRTMPDDPRGGVRYHAGARSNLDAATGADYLINTLPLTPATEDVLNAGLFARMKPGARLIQIGRGEHLVEADLTTALESGQLAGASLDVFRTEPLPEDDAFWGDPRIRITPHIASDSMPQIVCEQIVETARSLRDETSLRLGIDRARGY